MKKEGGKQGNKQANIAIAEIFYEIADILEMQNVRWKPQAFRVAAQTLESLRENIEDIYASGGLKALEALPGIGERLAQKIERYLSEGKIDEHEKLKKSIPHGLYEMMQIPGVGAKKALIFYKKLGIKNISELKKSAEQHKLRGMPGFKAKAESNLLEGIELLKGEKGRILLREAEKIALPVINAVGKIPFVKEAILGGSLRRKKATVRDLDILIRADDSKQQEILKKFAKMPFVKKVLGVGKEKATVIMKNGVQADARIFNDDEFGAGLLYFTGDKQHNIWLRKIAIKRGWKLNEYGLFKLKTGERIAGKTEAETYNKLGVKMPKPEDRIGETR